MPSALSVVGLSLGSRTSMAYAWENSLRLKHVALCDMGPQMAKAGAVGLKDDMTSKADRSPSTFTLVRGLLTCVLS